MQLKDVAVELGELTWKDVKLVAVHLNHMSWATLEEIENSSSVGKERVNRTIDTWLRSDVDASWAELVSALRAEKQNVIAERLRLRYCPSVPADTQPAADETVSLLREPTAAQPRSVPSVDPSHPSPPHPHSSISFSASTQATTHLSPSPVPLSPGLDQHSSTESPPPTPTPALASQPHGPVQLVHGNVAISESRIQQVEEEILHLDNHYADLRSDTHIYMVERERESPTFVDKFRITLLELPQHQQVKYPTLFEGNTYKIHEARNVSRIFDIIRPYSNYMNYELLQLIIKKFGNSSLKEGMSGYVVELETFELKTTIVEFVAATNDSTEIPECYRSVIVKINRDASQCTLHEVRVFIKKSLAKKSLFMPHALMLQQASSNTIIVKIGVSPESLSRLALAFDAKFREMHSVSQVIIDGDRLEVCVMGFIQKIFQRGGWGEGRAK